MIGKGEVVSSSLINSSAYNRADKCHRKVAFVVYIAVQTRLLTAIYTIKYNLVACRLDYNLAPSGSTSVAQLSLTPSKSKAVKPAPPLQPLPYQGRGRQPTQYTPTSK